MTPARKLFRWAAAVIIFAASSYPIRLIALRFSTISLSRSPLASFVKFLPKSQPENCQIHPPLPSIFSFAYANVSVTDSDESSYSAGTLGATSHIYVVSLPRRIDRRTRMEALFNFMSLDFTWWDATSSQDAIVGEIMERVRWERAMHVIYTHWGLFPQSSVAQAVNGGFGFGVPVQTHHGFKSASEVEAEDPIHWNKDAVANPSVYPPLHADGGPDISSESSNDSLRGSPLIDIEQERPGNGSPVHPLGLAGSELWILDPLRDARSTQRTNPIPPPPDPDLRLPLPCAPLHFTFDMPSMEDPDWEVADTADSILQRDDIDNNDEGGDFFNFTHLTPRDLNHEDLEREPAAEDDLDEYSSPRLRRHSMAPKSPYPFHLTLSQAMIACWHSHFRLLRHIASGSDEVAIVFEDDVDVEYDLPKVLNHLSGTLPALWDIVFLGHCWSSHEDTFPPLPLTTAPDYPDSSDSGHQPFPFRLHPSFTPKCTHAYAISRSGAARIVRHLRSTSLGLFTPLSSNKNKNDTTAERSTGSQDSDFTHRHVPTQRVQTTISGPSFAYGRALDQAFVRLIQGRRISAFSIVPSIAIQTKESPSDITPRGNGSTWRDVLRDSALTRLRAQGATKI